MSELVAITVHTQAADAERLSFEIYGEPIAPGMAITPSVNGSSYHGAWTLTHIESGRSLAPRAACLPCVRRVSEDIVKLGIDWTRPMDQVVKDDRAKDAALMYIGACQGCDDGWWCE